jgi:hypothetical protein
MAGLMPNAALTAQTEAAAAAAPALAKRVGGEKKFPYKAIKYKPSHNAFKDCSGGAEELGIR